MEAEQVEACEKVWLKTSIKLGKHWCRCKHRLSRTLRSPVHCAASFSAAVIKVRASLPFFSTPNRSYVGQEMHHGRCPKGVCPERIQSGGGVAARRLSWSTVVRGLSAREHASNFIVTPVSEIREEGCEYNRKYKTALSTAL
jgi:hypothetical protein